ncbi:hypothetical protein FDECE_3626 [Fusarium decemcellulare]|nr:hypothetical protein FDECE_3626 [Fusarium decemcellulare]
MKPSTYVFDADGDTELILKTCQDQVLYWDDEVLSVGQEKPKTNHGKRKRQSTSQRRNQKGKFDKPVDEDIKHLHLGERPGTVPGQIEVGMLVSKKHLALASPYFRKMFSGPFAEANVGDGGHRQVRASDWDPEAFILLLNIIHGHHREVPKQIDLRMLAKLSIIVDYYECHESMDVYADIWLKHLQDELPRTYGGDCMLWLLISWVFSREDIFESMVALALRSSKQLIEAKDLPIPADLLKRIDQGRQDILEPVFSKIYGLLDGLLENSECSYECSCMLLGCLTKHLSKHGMLNPRITGPFNGFSVDGIQETFQELEAPKYLRWGDHRSFSQPHQCNIKAKLQPVLRDVEYWLRGVFWEDIMSMMKSKTKL